LFLLLLSLVSFGKSFRVGIDRDHPDELVTTGIFGFSRNPIYVAFWIFLLGQFLVFPNWILLVYLIAVAWLFNRQVLREEEYMRNHYGQPYLDYCRRVRRYLQRGRGHESAGRMACSTSAMPRLRPSSAAPRNNAVCRFRTPPPQQ
jgi:protein-S-isoprenylcysteine O-methyltransferase Ste14